MSKRAPRIVAGLPWDSPHPYTVLRRFGIGPEATTTQVLDLPLSIAPELMADPEMHEAWEALRLTKSRLLIDFFCPELPPPVSASPTGQVPAALLERLSDSLPELPLPVIHPLLPQALDEAGGGKGAQIPGLPPPQEGSTS